MGSIAQTVKKMVGVRSGRLAQMWDYDSHSKVLAPPIVADIDLDGKEEIIIATEKGELIVLNVDSKELWRYNIAEQVDEIDGMFMDTDVMNSINAVPALGDLTGDGKNNIVFGSEMGIMYCLDEKGTLLWKFKTAGGIRGSPILADINDDGKLEVVFGSTDSHLYLLNGDGSLIEKFEQESPIESTPGYWNGLIVFGCNDGSVVALTSKGEEKWVHKTKSKVTAAPAFARLTKTPVDVVIIPSTDNVVYCLDVDGELVWTYETQGAIYSQATIADINGDGNMEVLVGSCDNNVHAITCDGDKLWTYQTDFWVVGSPLVGDVDGDGKLEVIVGSYDHNIYVLDSEGSYLLDYVPGLSGVVQQTGNYSEVMTEEPGDRVGKRLWQFKTSGVIIGCTQIRNSIIVTTKKGVVNALIHQK